MTGSQILWSAMKFALRFCKFCQQSFSGNWMAYTIVTYYNWRRMLTPPYTIHASTLCISTMPVLVHFLIFFTMAWSRRFIPKLFGWHSSRDIVRMKWRYYRTGLYTEKKRSHWLKQWPIRKGLGDKKGEKSELNNTSQNRLPILLPHTSAKAFPALARPPVPDSFTNPPSVNIFLTTPNVPQVTINTSSLSSLELALHFISLPWKRRSSNLWILHAIFKSWSVYFAIVCRKILLSC